MPERQPAWSHRHSGHSTCINRQTTLHGIFRQAWFHHSLIMSL